ncbi:MAG: hypothetical protein KKH11_06720, partial [Candidatus Omnitrophica bacterium]|nr:hypothetical protein [Candidatus Omnitrophota bacterium]
FEFFFKKLLKELGIDIYSRAASANNSSSPVKADNEKVVGERRETIESFAKPLIEEYGRWAERLRRGLNKGMTPRQAIEEMLPALLKAYSKNREKGIPTVFAFSGLGASGKSTLVNFFVKIIETNAGLVVKIRSADDRILPNDRRPIDFKTKKSTEYPNEKFELWEFFVEEKKFKQGGDSYYTPLFDRINRDRITLMALNKVKIMIKDGDLILCLDLGEQQAEPMLEFWGQEDKELSLGDRKKSFSLGERAEASVKRDESGRIVLTIADTGHILQRRPQGVSLIIEGRKEIILKPGEWTDALQRIIPGKGIFFVDWILSLSPPKDLKVNLKELYDLTVFVDVHEDCCLARAVRRAEYEKGRKMSREEVLEKKEILQATENPVIEKGFLGADFMIDGHSRFESLLCRIWEGELTDSQFKPYLDELGIKAEDLIVYMKTIQEREKFSDKEAVISQLAFLEQTVREADIRFILALLHRVDRQRLKNNIKPLQLNSNDELLQLIWLRLYMQTINPAIPKYKALCKLYDKVIEQPALLSEDKFAEDFFERSSVVILDKQSLVHELYGYRKISSAQYEQDMPGERKHVRAEIKKALKRLEDILDIAKVIYGFKDKTKQAAGLLNSICKDQKTSQAGYIGDLRLLSSVYEGIDEKLAVFKGAIDELTEEAEGCSKDERMELEGTKEWVRKIISEVKSTVFYLLEHGAVTEYAFKKLIEFI